MHAKDREAAGVVCMMKGFCQSAFPVYMTYVILIDMFSAMFS